MPKKVKEHDVQYFSKSDIEVNYKREEIDLFQILDLGSFVESY